LALMVILSYMERSLGAFSCNFSQYIRDRRVEIGSRKRRIVGCCGRMEGEGLLVSARGRRRNYKKQIKSVKPKTCET
jgi:hypothetical protein